MSMGREYHRNYSREYYHTRKNELLFRLGNKCAVCGISEGLTFDHIDPLKKSFNISHLLNRSKEDTDLELTKCQLLCRKCHIEKNRVDGSRTKNSVKGSRVGSAVLDEAKVRIIRKMLEEGEKGNKIARMFKVNKATIYFIRKGVTWKHVI